MESGNRESNNAIGALLLLTAVLTTCVNEMRVIHAQRSFEQARVAAVELLQPVYDPRNDGQLIAFSGLITTDSDVPVLDHDGNKIATRSPFVLDPLFGIAVKGVRLYRQVEMLQWVEASHTSTSSTPEDEDRRVDDNRDRVYMYDLRWRSERIDSSAFNDISYWNPPQEAWIYEANIVKAVDVVVGDFKLSDTLIDQIERRDDVALDPSTRKTMANVLTQRLGGNWADASALRNVSIEEDKYFYVRQNQNRNRQKSPASVLGDLRISFAVTPAYPVTICAQQQQRSLLPFPTKAGDEIFLVQDGIHSASELFAHKLDAKFRANRFYRLFTGVLGFIGFLVLHSMIVERLGGVALAIAPIHEPVLAGALSCALTFTVVGFNWLLYTPLYLTCRPMCALSSPLWALALWAGGITPMLLLLVYVKQKLKNE
ncbi:Transmembrane protein 43 family, partial [Globisporangium splendens]